MARRKTVSVVDMLEKVNQMNRESTCAADIRHGWNSLLECMLHDAGVYAGFGYLNASQVPTGCLPGIVWDGQNQPSAFPDESRRLYYTHHSLQNS